MKDEPIPGSVELTDTAPTAQEIDAQGDGAPVPPGLSPSAAKTVARRRFRRVLIDDGSARVPAEQLATQFPARRPNRRRSPRLTPPVRPDRRIQ